MFHHSPKINLAPSKTLELVRLQLKQAHDSKDPEIILIICNFAVSLLTSLKSVVNLAPSKTLEVVRWQLKQAYDSKDPEIILIICNFADSLLASLKSVVKRSHRVTSSSGTIHNVDPDQESLLCHEIASAYLDHANLMADLGHADLAQNSRKRADKWG